MTSARPTPKSADVEPADRSELQRREQDSSEASSEPTSRRITGPATKSMAESDASVEAKPGLSVRLEGLRAFYGDAEQVKGVDLEFRANKVTAIIGPSGCGKSTMVRCINRMHEEIPGGSRGGKGDAR